MWADAAVLTGVLLGFAALVVAVVCGAVAVRSWLRARALQRCAVVPVGELRAESVQPCQIAGRAWPYGDGELTSPLTGLDAVWYRQRVTRRYEQTYRDSDGNRKRRTRYETLAEESSTAPFRAGDATGSVLVRPGEHRVTGAEKVLDRFEPHPAEEPSAPRPGARRERTLGHRREEWIVRPGAPLFVHGVCAEGEVTGGDGLLEIGAPAGGGTFVLSVRPKDQLLRAGRRRAYGFALTAATAALAGAALLTGLT
ncbi:GIDE domain-containing protein [Streptomyces sp. HNM0574]|uniref:GIDE domain-containing protein n=1 Tax=Streptomyces sp. HNM0574 TaxID=2714954 RepID=UPI00146AD70F|nr:GIDE domain-containing protein [Streptomyces sp. HNM0574]NLU66269.1 hypothetical protein [Streptomyces sp. HNM0574]